MNSGSTTHQKKKVLTPQQITICKYIAALKIDLISKRASALLALHEGATQNEAAEKSDLTLGQVRYLRVIFRENGMAIFPADLLEQAKKTKSKKAAKEKTKVNAEKEVKKKSKKDKAKKKKAKDKKKSVKSEDKKKKKNKSKKKAKGKKNAKKKK